MSVNYDTGEIVDLMERIALAQRVSDIGDRSDIHVYFIQRGEGGPIKIGASSNVVRRLAELQIGAPEDMRIVGVWIYGGRSGERGLHRMHSTDRIGGEWFAPTDEVWASAREFGGAR